jgi:Fe-S cluster biogenesis protein NfuA
LDSLLDTVVKIVNDRINPLLAVDRGAIEIVDVREDEGVVLVRYTGRCAGCPALSITHRKIVSAALISADRSIRKVDYTLMPSDEA